MLSAPAAIYREHSLSVSATARKERRLRNDIERWINLAGTPGPHELDVRELETLKGSLAILLITGFGAPSSLRWFFEVCRNYLKAISIAASGGYTQLKRFHWALIKKVAGTLKTS